MLASVAPSLSMHAAETDCDIRRFATSTALEEKPLFYRFTRHERSDTPPAGVQRRSDVQPPNIRGDQPHQNARRMFYQQNAPPYSRPNRSGVKRAQCE